ncbi:hypothetical protein [Infirmifilum sp. SLHALR2]
MQLETVMYCFRNSSNQSKGSSPGTEEFDHVLLQSPASSLDPLFIRLRVRARRS